MNRSTLYLGALVFLLVVSGVIGAIRPLRPTTNQQVQSADTQMMSHLARK